MQNPIPYQCHFPLENHTAAVKCRYLRNNLKKFHHPLREKPEQQGSQGKYHGDVQDCLLPSCNGGNGHIVAAFLSAEKRIQRYFEIIEQGDNSC